MDLKTLATTFPALLDAGQSIELISQPGVGKSEFVEQQVAANSQRTGQQWGFAKLFLATMTPADLMGYMIPSTDSRGRAVSTFTMPPWMQTEDGKAVEDFERGILFLDEYGQGDADVKRASAELLLNRRLGQWALPKGWSVVAASNRAKDRSGVTKSFDFVINRRMEINVHASVTAWESWAQDNGVDPIIQFFATQNPGIVFDGNVPKEQGPWCTPRSLVMAGKALHALRGFDDEAPMPQTPEARELITGLIGAGAAEHLFVTLKLAYEMPSVEDIISDPEGTAVPRAPDARMLVAHQLAMYADEDTLDPIVTYVQRFPKEFAVSFAERLMRRSGDFRLKALDTPAFGRWLKDNGSLYMSIQSGR